MKKWLLLSLKLVLTSVCLWWAFSRIDWSESHLLEPGALIWKWMVLGIGLAGCSVWLTAFRLKVLLGAQGIPLTMRRAFVLTLIGDCFNLISFASIGGDAVKIFLLIREHPERKLAVTMTVLFDHLVGLVSMALVFFMFTAGSFKEAEVQSLNTEMILKFAWLYFSGGLVMIVLMSLVAWPPVNRFIHRGVRKPKSRFIRRIPRIYDVYRKRWPAMVLAVVAALIMLPIYYATFWCGTRAAGSDVALSSVLAAMPIVDMISALPVSISGLGVREISMKYLMRDLTGMPSDIAVGGSLIGFFCSFVWAISGGVLFLRPQNRAKVDEIEEATAEDDAD